jgi:hypothetical protein
MDDEHTHADKLLLAQMRAAAFENFQFFSDKRKEERERWVVREFLLLLSLACTEDEIKSEPQASKVDVLFRDARFQIKEATDPHIKRTKETKADFKRLAAAKTLGDTVSTGHAYDMPPAINGYSLIRGMAQELGGDRRYSTVKQNLDLLIYVTRPAVSLIGSSEINHKELALLGWRTIAVLMGSQALVLYANEAAPDFLRSRVTG